MKNVECEWAGSDGIPSNDLVWLVFDLSNTNPGSVGYVWYFSTREQAREHKKHVKRMRYGAELSSPIKYRKVK